MTSVVVLADHRVEVHTMSAWIRTAHEIRETVRGFLLRMDDGELAAASVAGFGHLFVVPESHPGEPPEAEHTELPLSA